MEVFRRMIDHLGAVVGPRGRSVSAKRKRLCTSDSATSLHASRARPSTSRDSGFLLSCRGPVLLWTQASVLIRAWRGAWCVIGRSPTPARRGARISNGARLYALLCGLGVRRLSFRSHQAAAPQAMPKMVWRVPNRNSAGSQKGLVYHIWNPTPSTRRRLQRSKPQPLTVIQEPHGTSQSLLPT
jgi:hypothetical protein